jgi:hypothetical protein
MYRLLIGVFLSAAVLLLGSCEEQPTSADVPDAPEQPAEDGSGEGGDDAGGTSEPENTPPEVTIQTGTTDLDYGESTTLTAKIEDPDDSIHYRHWFIDGEYVSNTPGLGFARRPDALTEYEVSITVTDGQAEASDSITLSVAGPGWQPATGCIYTAPAEIPRDDLEANDIREKWCVETASEYHNMIGRVESTVEGHNMNHPNDQLQVVGGGAPK